MFLFFPRKENGRSGSEKRIFVLKSLKEHMFDIGGGDSQLQILLNLIEKYQIDLIHSHFGMFHHALVFQRNKLGNIKIVLHDHMDFGLTPNIVIQKLRMAVYSVLYQMKHISVISVMEKKNNAYVFLKKKWFVPNGISLERYITRSMSREECRKALGLKANDKCVFLLGWDLKRKGLDIALKAIQKCREMDTSICFGMIGVGTRPADYAIKFIAKETGLNPVEPWIHFLTVMRICLLSIALQMYIFQQAEKKHFLMDC